jgi:hypothetical protein
LAGHIFKQHHTPSLVASGQVGAVRIEFYGRNDISCI